MNEIAKRRADWRMALLMTALFLGIAAWLTLIGVVVWELYWTKPEVIEEPCVSYWTEDARLVNPCEEES